MCTSSAVTLRPLESIVEEPGLGRKREDRLAFAALLMPLAIDESDRMLSGADRLELARSLGWSHVDVRVWESIDDPGLQLQLEWESNLGRADLPLLTQARYVREVLRPVFEARVAMVQRGNAKRLNEMLGNEVENFATSLPTPVGKWRDYVSARVSFGGHTMSKFMAMQDWSSDERLNDLDRKRIQDEVMAANETSKVDAPFRRARAIHRAATTPPDSPVAVHQDVSRVVLQLAKAELALAGTDTAVFASAIAGDVDALEDLHAAALSVRRIHEQFQQLITAATTTARLQASA